MSLMSIFFFQIPNRPTLCLYENHINIHYLISFCLFLFRYAFVYSPNPFSLFSLLPACSKILFSLLKFFFFSLSLKFQGPQVCCCMDTVACWSECILDLVQPTTDVLGEELRPEDDNVLSALLSFQTCEDKIRLEALDEIVSAISTVLQRQLASVISSNFVSPSTETGPYWSYRLQLLSVFKQKY